MDPIASPAYRAAQVTSALTALIPTNLIHLFKNDIVPQPLTVLADFIEADFDGYVAAEVGTVTNGTDGATGDLLITSIALAPIVAGTPDPPQVVYGWYLTDALGDNWLMANLFPTPINVFVPGQQIPLTSVTLRIFPAQLHAWEPPG